MNKYTINQFRKEFSSDDVCLEYVFKKRFPEAKRYYRQSGRKCFVNNKGEAIYPLVGTIFEKSTTSLVDWFYVMFLFSVSKNGISAKEVQRQIGVTYKCAWRMCSLIRAGKGTDFVLC